MQIILCRIGRVEHIFEVEVTIMQIHESINHYTFHFVGQ